MSKRVNLNNKKENSELTSEDLRDIVEGIEAFNRGEGISIEELKKELLN